MNNFSIIYKILKQLEINLDCEEINLETFSNEKLKISYERWEQLLIMLFDNGYIQGIQKTKSFGDCKYHITEPIQPQITLKGSEYLQENPMMIKAKSIAKGAVDIATKFI